MKNFRNMKLDKMMYNDGKWKTVYYSDDDIKRLAYYNIDLPHVVGIGTNKPFSKLSFGDSSGSGDHKSTSTSKLTPGEVTAIALNELPINKDITNSGTEIEYDGQDFSGFSYVTNLKSIRKIQDNDGNYEEAKGIGLYANKSNVSQDTSLKTDKAIMYVTDDNLVRIGGVPEEFDFIDTRFPRILPGSEGSTSNTGSILTGPNVILDVSGSVHVNGFINFLKNGATSSQETDNPAGQLTYDVSNQRIDYNSNPTDLTGCACPEGAIWVGWDIKNDAFQDNFPRLWIQRRGKKTKVLTEEDQDIFNNTQGGLWEGNADDDGKEYYVFKNPTNNPNNSLINTFIGRPGSSSGAKDFINDGTNDLPKLWDLNTSDTTPPSALSVVGNLSVFDFTTGGVNGVFLKGDGTANDGGVKQDLMKYKRILQSDIYVNTDTNSTSDAKGQRELGSIYCDRHIMIGGFKGPIIDTSTTAHPKFDYFSSAIDISGGIFKKPVMRVLTGSNKGSLVTTNPDGQITNCQDSVIIGNTPADKFISQNS